MTAVEPPPLGYLIVNVLEAAGHDAEDAPVWDAEFKQGYARGEPGAAASKLCACALCSHTPACGASSVK